MKRRGKGPARRSQDMHSVLFNRRSQPSVDSVVVPETPTNLTCARPSTAPSSSMMSVMETPEDEAGGRARGSSHAPLNVQGDRGTGTEIPTDSNSDRDEINSSTVLDITPDLKLGKRRNLMSILESEDSFARSLKSQRTKNSSMLVGIQAAGQQSEEDLDFLLVSPVKKSKRRRSAAHVIMPFDLNDSESLSSKLRTIEESECRPRRSVGGMALEGLESEARQAKERRRSASRGSRATGRRKSLIVPLSADSSEDDEVVFNTQSENPVFRGSYPKQGPKENTDYSKEASQKIDVISRSNANSGINNSNAEKQATSWNTRGGGGDATKIFDSEDLDLTPIKTSSQETSIQNIIAGLGSQPATVDETLPHAPPVGCGVAGMSFQNFSTRSVKLLQAQLPAEARGAGGVTGTTGGKGDAGGGMHADWMEPSEASESAATEPDVTVILRGVVACVEVRMGSDNRSQVIKEQLKVLGAEVRERLSQDTTHVIFKDGSKATFNRAQKRGLHLVSSLWVEACREKLQRVPESLYPSCSIDTYKTPLFMAKKLRKLKSMQPKEFSEEERIANVRALRRLKAAEQSPEAQKKLNFFTPPLALPAIEEQNKDSPLFGISHLLTPKRCSSSSNGTASGTETEEEEEEGGLRGSPEKYMTPLVRRLYNRFLSPRTDSAQRKRAAVGRESPLHSTDPKGRLKCLSEESSSDAGAEGTSSGLQQEAVGRTKTTASGTEAKEDGRKSGLEGEEKDGGSERLKAEGGKDCNEKRRIRGRGGGPKESGETTESERDSKAAGDSTKGSESLDLVLSDSSQDRSSSSEGGAQGRRSSRRRRNGDSTHNSVGGENCAKKKKSPTPGEEPVTLVNSFISRSLIGRTLDDPYDAELGTEQEGNAKQDEKKMRRKSILKKAESTSRQRAEQKRKSVSYGGADTFEVEVTDPPLTPTREKVMNHRVPPALSSPSFGATSSQPPSSLPASQLRGHRLFNLDPMAPSQDLIVPSTPEDPKKFLRRPYTDLVIRGSRTQRTALKSQKGGSLSSMPLPRNPSPGRRVRGSSQAKQGTQGASTAPVRRSMRLSAAPVKKVTQGDEDVFLGSEEEEGEEFLRHSRIPLLPRPRRSTEEFQHAGELKAKGRRGRRPKGDSLPSLYVSSVHSKYVAGS